MARPRTSKIWRYQYTPKGDHKDEIIKWLEAQQKMDLSLNLLIMQALQDYGETDLVEKFASLFFAQDQKTLNTTPTVNDNSNDVPNSAKTTTHTENNTSHETATPSTRSGGTATENKPKFGILDRKH